jgi:hypothetical protein
VHYFFVVRIEATTNWLFIRKDPAMTRITLPDLLTALALAAVLTVLALEYFDVLVA